MRGVEKFGKCLQGKQKSFKVSLATFWSSNAEVLKTILRLGMWYDSCHIVSYECDCVCERSAFNKNVLWRRDVCLTTFWSSKQCRGSKQSWGSVYTVNLSLPSEKDALVPQVDVMDGIWDRMGISGLMWGIEQPTV